jgi:catechol 2,3-dioxygenase-like lactoylglutathione lyase family enzyme
MLRIGMTTLLVRDYDEAIRFYVDAIGFRLEADTALGGDTRWVVVAPPGAAGASILLARADTDAQRSHIGDQAGGRVLLFLETDDFSGDHQRMLAAGVNFLEPPRFEDYGVVAVFEDLYGNRWDLIQPKR